ncbi:MAG TPA: hypothetical protein VHD38_01845, partial [Candidatus Paceibacterota bacterium]|nr:hypothetical protein [Candidatus Paceibacterota bacterium]
IEPVYVVRANDPTLYWKYTITNVNYSGISATAVTNSSKPDEIQVFRDRSLYEAWLEGADVGDRPGANTGKGGDIKIELLSTIEKISKELTTLRQRVESLPAH